MRTTRSEDRAMKTEEYDSWQQYFDHIERLRKKTGMSYADLAPGEDLMIVLAEKLGPMPTPPWK